jgi:hypothetical protein
MSLRIWTHRDPIQRQNYQIATHEAAHAVIARELGLQVKKKGIVLTKVENSTAVKCYESGSTYIRDKGRHSSDPKRRTAFHRRNIAMLLAGPLAERKVFIQNPTIDPEVTQIELSLSVLMPKTQEQVSDEYDDEADRTANFWWLIKTLSICIDRVEALNQLVENDVKFDHDIFDFLWPLAQQARILLSKHWSLIERLASSLTKNGGLSGKQVEELLSDEESLTPAS